AQFTMQSVRFFSCEEMKYDSRVTPGEAFDDRRAKVFGDIGTATDPDFPSSRVGEKLDILYALLQLVERGHPLIQHGPTALGRLDALCVAVEKARADGMFQFRD